MVIAKAAMVGGGVRRFWRRWWRPPYSYLVALLLVGGCTAWESQTAVIRDQVALLLTGHAPHRVPCRQWPTYAEVERRYAENRGLIDAIEAAGRWGSRVSVRPGRGQCADRAEFYIEYAGWRERDAIQQLIGDDRFLLGVPYSMRNV